MTEPGDEHPTETVTGCALADATDLTLVVVEGRDVGLRIEMKWGSFTVGKSSRCDLTLTDPGVSRRHLSITRRASSLEVRDLDSRNGSYFQGARFERIDVGVGATIRIGRSMLRVVTTSDDEAEDPPPQFGAMRGHSAAMRQVFGFLARAARSDMALLVQGETGTGKELVARGLHEASGRKGPLVICDLAGIAPALIESELFGHARGAFTGADSDRAGAFLRADGGTLFLDEIGELALEQQPRLLRALESSEVKPVGDNRYRKVDVRIVAATNRDLATDVAERFFRADLYHRLAVFCVALPPLRERRDDIPLLVKHFVSAAAPPAASPHIPEPTMTALVEHDWPGNVRELRNVIERAIALTAERGSLTREVLGLDDERPVARPGQSSPDLSRPFKEAKDSLVQAWERDYLTNLMAKCEGNVSLAARRAGMHRVHLHRLLKKHGLGE